MRKYPVQVAPRLSRTTGAHLENHAAARGVNPGELARELIEEGIARLNGEPSTPIWLEMLTIEVFRTRGIVLTLLGELIDKRGWNAEYLAKLHERTRREADEFALQRLAEIEAARAKASPAKRR